MPADSWIVVGVVPERCQPVLRVAAHFARRFDARLAVAHVAVDRVEVDELDDGSVLSEPIDPDVEGPRVERVDPALEAAVAAALDDCGPGWEIHQYAGDPAAALSRLAERLDAHLIVVGTRQRGLRGTVGELLSGSVGAHLAHRQHRPVLVVPADPVEPASTSDA